MLYSVLGCPTIEIVAFSFREKESVPSILISFCCATELEAGGALDTAVLEGAGAFELATEFDDTAALEETGGTLAAALEDTATLDDSGGFELATLDDIGGTLATLLDGTELGAILKLDELFAADVAPEEFGGMLATELELAALLGTDDATLEIWLCG